MKGNATARSYLELAGPEADVGTCRLLDVGLTQALAKLLRHRTLVELRAGMGCYSEMLTHLGVPRVTALDGTHDIGDITGGRVQTWDPTLPFSPTGELADFALVFFDAVGERDHNRFELDVVRTASEAAVCGVVIAWGPQRRVETPEEQQRAWPRQHVKSALASHGLVIHRQHTRQLREAASLPLLQRTVAMYTRPSPTPGCPENPKNGQ